ncbi:RNA 2',3'-cyclic phosphodiesterase [archaeon]|nr:RNA 2',3'-cyclic phosphodiesterase [archaeon]
MRCFIGVPLNKKTRQELTKIQQHFCESNTKMKLVEPENLHVTLHFLGEIKNTEPIKKKLAQIKQKSFELQVNGLGAFPNKNHARVLWARINKGKETLKSLHDEITHGEYHPHITLARIRTKPDETLKKLLEQQLQLSMPVNKIVLYQSTLTPDGPKYSKVQEIELD